MNRGTYFQTKKVITGIIRYTVTYGLLIFVAFPFFWILSCSLKGSGEIMAVPPAIIPKNITFENYSNAIIQNNVGNYLWNSVVVSVGSVLLTIILGALAAYAIEFFKFKGKEMFSTLLVTIQILPGVISLVALFLIFNKMHIINTRMCLIIAYTSAPWCIPVAILLLRAYFMEIPKAIQEAAYIDGCSNIGIFFRMVIPLSVPGIISTCIFIFVGVWQEVLLAVSLISDSEKYTLPVGLKNFQGMYSTDWGGMMATSVIIAIPSIILFVAVQNYFINNLVGSVKG